MKVLAVVMCCLWSGQLALAQPAESPANPERQWARDAMDASLAPLLKRHGQAKYRIGPCRPGRCVVHVRGTARCRVVLRFTPTSGSPGEADAWASKLRCR